MNAPSSRGMREEFYDLVHAVGSRQFWLTLAVTWVGVVAYSIGVNALLVPHQFVATGATGIALVIYYFAGWPQIGIIYWLINIPILLVGWRAMSMKFVFLALIGAFMSGLAITITRGIQIPTSDPLMAAILSGVLTGGGSGLYLRFGGSAGGMDIVAAVMRRRFGVPMGTTFLAVNAINFIGGGIHNGSLERLFYSAVAMAVHVRVLEFMQGDFASRKAVLIVTVDPEGMADAILRRLRRGATFLHGSGGMSQRSLKVIYTVVNVVEVARLKELIFHCDKNAFVSVLDLSEVIGARFRGWSDHDFQGPQLNEARGSKGRDAGS